MGGVWERAKDLWDLGTHSLWLTLLVRKTALDCRKTSRHVHLVNREAFGVNLNSPSLNTHTHRGRRWGIAITLHLSSLGTICSVCSSWLRQTGEFVSQSPEAGTAVRLPGWSGGWVEELRRPGVIAVLSLSAGSRLPSAGLTHFSSLLAAFLSSHVYQAYLPLPWSSTGFQGQMPQISGSDWPLLLLLRSRFSHVRLCATPETAAHQALLSLGFSRQEHWSGLPFPSPLHESEKWKWSRSVVSDS